MSFVTTAPQLVATAASDLAGIRSAISAANAAAAGPTTRLPAAAADEVSAAIASLFSSHAQGYQALGAQATAFQDQFVRLLNGAGAAYISAEDANVSPLQTFERDMLAAINTPTETLLGRPLIGDGANGTASSPNGQPAGCSTATAATATRSRLGPGAKPA